MNSRLLLLGLATIVLGIIGISGISMGTSTSFGLPHILYFLSLFLVLSLDKIVVKFGYPRFNWKEVCALLFFSMLLGNSLLTGDEQGIITLCLLISWLGVGWWFRKIELPRFVFFNHRK